MTWQNILKSALIPSPVSNTPVVAPGLFHFLRHDDGAYVRFHLRVDPGGHSILIAGAAEAVQLSPQSTYIAKRLLEDESTEELTADLPPSFAEEVASIGRLLEELSRPRGRYPILSFPEPATTISV